MKSIKQTYSSLFGNNSYDEVDNNVESENILDLLKDFFYRSKITIIDHKTKRFKVVSDRCIFDTSTFPEGIQDITLDIMSENNEPGFLKLYISDNCQNINNITINCNTLHIYIEPDRDVSGFAFNADDAVKIFHMDTDPKHPIKNIKFDSKINCKNTKLDFDGIDKDIISNITKKCIKGKVSDISIYNRISDFPLFKDKQSDLDNEIESNSPDFSAIIDPITDGKKFYGIDINKYKNSKISYFFPFATSKALYSPYLKKDIKSKCPIYITTKDENHDKLPVDFLKTKYDNIFIELMN